MTLHVTQKTDVDTQLSMRKKISSFRAYLFFINVQSKRFRYFLFLALILISSVVTAALPIVTSKTAYAAPGGVYADPTLMSDIAAYAYRNALIECIQRSFNSDALNIDASQVNISNATWFGTKVDKISGIVGLPVIVSRAQPPNCQNMPLKVIEASGWTSKTEAACAMQIIVSPNGRPCTDGADGYKPGPISLDKIVKAIDDKRFGGKADFTDAMYYLLYARTMEAGCQATPSIAFDDASVDEQNLVGTSDTLVINVVSTDASITKTIYKLGIDRDKKAGLAGLGQKDNNTTGYSCVEVATKSYPFVNAYVAYVKSHPPAPGAATDPTSPECAVDPNNVACAPGTTGSPCVIDKIGWILCPIIDVGSSIVDGAYSAVAAMLTVPAVNTDTTGAMYKAWSIMRNFANVAFVIAFLIVIYSQLTGAGLSNFGIKKLLPRILVAAILVNVSFWICAIAVDLSNILGSSLKGLLDSVAGQLYSSSSTASDFATSSPNIISWRGLAGGLLVAGALLYVTLSALLPMLVVALLAIVTVMLVLTLRQALIIILIVISPLAFVAYLLPNTSDWFKKWRQLFQTLLLMFPIIAIIFGGSALASTVIMEAAAQQKPVGTEETVMHIVLQIMAAGVTVIPLFITPVVMKTAGGLLNRFGGIVNNPNKGPFDRMRKGAEGYRDRRKETRLMNALDPDKRSMPGRGAFARRKDRQDRTHKAKMSAYENKLESNWGKTEAGMAAKDALKKTVLQSEIDKAASEIRFNTSGNLDLQLKAKIAKMEVDASESEQDAILKEVSSAVGGAQQAGVSTAVKLAAQNVATAKNLNDLRTGSAQRVLQQEQAANIEKLTTGHAQYAGGVDKFGAQRAIGNATALMQKAFDEAVSSERSTMTSQDADQLTAIMIDATQSQERRAAAASQILKVGSDKNIHETLTYLGTTAGTEEIQKQVAADIGGRRPASIGSSDVSSLAKGVYSGTFEEKIAARIGGGKLSAEDLSKASSDELDSIKEFLRVNSAALRADPKTLEAITALETDINEFRSNPQLKGRQPAFEIGSRMDDIHGLL